jgi:hypothetical protein
MDPVLLGAAALALLAIGKGAPAGRSGGPSSSQDAEVAFGPVTAPGEPPKTFFCAPWSSWGGFSDEVKISLATDLYVQRWAFDPPAEFGPYIAKLDPCEPSHVPTSLLDQFPPFPNQKLKASELARLAKTQAEARASRKAQEASSRETCKKASQIIGTVVGAAAGATATLVTAGAAAPAAPAAAAAGTGLGTLIGSFC